MIGSTKILALSGTTLYTHGGLTLLTDTVDHETNNYCGELKVMSMTCQVNFGPENFGPGDQNS